MRIKALLLMLFVVSGTHVFSIDHKTAFGENWLQAEQYVREHRAEWKKTFKEFGVNPKVAEAVIFPELIRYSRWQDKIESSAVATLYVTKGKRLADFSIGRFQMKPSFTEEVEKEWNRSTLARKYSLTFDTDNTSEARRERTTRLKSAEGQCRYLAIFIRLQQIRHPELLRCSKTEQVRRLATLYNGSYTASWQELEKLSHEKYYHTDMFKTKKTSLYCYADIAVEFYQRDRQ